MTAMLVFIDMLSAAFQLSRSLGVRPEDAMHSIYMVLQAYPTEPTRATPAK